MTQINASAYTDLLGELANCRTDEQMIDLLYKKQRIVDGHFLRFFTDPHLVPFTVSVTKGGKKMESIQKWVDQQFTLNVVTHYINQPDSHVKSYIQEYILVLLLEYAFDCFQNLITYYWDDEDKSNFVIARFQLLIGSAIDYMLALDDPDAVKTILYRGPSYFINPLAEPLLQQYGSTDTKFKFRSINLVNEILIYKHRFPEAMIIDPEVRILLDKGFSTHNWEEKIEFFKSALSIAKKESAEIIANTQFYLADFYVRRLQGAQSANIETAIALFNNVLLFFTKDLYPYRWASIQNGLARCYAVDQRLDPGENIETSIRFLKETLRVFTPHEMPYDWATAQNNIGAAYLERLKGNKIENIKTAIEYFNLSLTIQTSKFTPEDWALTMTNLGEASNNKHASNRKESAEMAIGYFTKALSIYSKEDNPIKWGELKVKIGAAYNTMAAYSPAENFEEALECLNDSLTVLNPEDSPNEWATAQWYIGETYMERINGERIENLERAIEHFNNVFLVHKFDSAPYSWAMNHVNLANVYRNRLRGSGADNQEKAMHHLHESLRVLDQSRFAIDWASVQHLLGIIYHKKITGDKTDNYEKSITFLQNALQIRTAENVPTSWAESMNSLGTAYKDRILGLKMENQEKAIACFTQISKILEPATHPVLWAIVQYNCGLVYAQRQKGDPVENTASAINLLQDALTIQTPIVNQIECFKIASNLGNIFYNCHKYDEAIKAFSLCHQSAENMRRQSVRENTRKQIAGECSVMYAKLVAACLAVKDTGSAFYYASSAKARVFSDRLGSSIEQPEKMLHNKPDFTTSWEAIINVRQEIDKITSQREFLYTKGEALAEDGRTLASIISDKREKLSQLLDDIFFNFPEFSRATDAPIADPEKIKGLSQELGNVPLVEYYENEKGWGAFIVYQNKIEHIDLPGVTYESIEPIKKFMLEYEEGVLANKSPDSYAGSLNKHLSNLYQLLVEPLSSFLPADGPLVMAPAQDLHLLPFNISFDALKKLYLVDAYTITYIPSLGALYTLSRQLKTRVPGKNENTLLSVVYSAKDIGSPLPNALKEAKIIAGYFLPAPPSVYLHEQSATPQNVLEACEQRQFNTVHFSCHGHFNFNDPGNSGLLLNNGLLTVERIKTELRLSSYPTVILSACQTGQFRSDEGDEAVGLIQSFYSAGAGSIISSQWSVEDESTKELFNIFYEKTKSMKFSEAFRAAMLAIRREQRWHQPIFWAAFKITGLPI